MVPRSIVMVTHLEYLGIDSILFLEIKTDKLDCQVCREAAQLGLKRTAKEGSKLKTISDLGKEIFSIFYTLTRKQLLIIIVLLKRQIFSNMKLLLYSVQRCSN